MKLREDQWIIGGGLTPEWRRVSRQRSEEAREKVARVLDALPKAAPTGVLGRGYSAGLRYFLRGRGADRERLALHPALDYWLFLWEKHFRSPCREEDWLLQMSQFQGLAAGLAWSRGERAGFNAVLDPNGRFHLHGTPYAIVHPRSSAGRPLTLESRGGALRSRGPGGLTSWLSLARARRLPPGESKWGAARLERAREIRPGLVVEHVSWLMTHGVSVHGLGRLEADDRVKFADVLAGALEDLEAAAPALAAEFLDMVRAVIPLENPRGMGSVSSSYVNLRGAICLSHSTDRLLQAETFIHEFCHQKMNQLLTVEPILAPGQGGQVFYSPWREDPRRLRGLLLGAHAFLNVSAFLLRTLREGDDLPEARRVSIMVNVAQRLIQVETALRSVAAYATMTEFGRRFVLGMSRELGLLNHSAAWFPPRLLAEAQARCRSHRRKFAFGETGLYRSPSLKDKIRRVPFHSPSASADAPARK